MPCYERLREKINDYAYLKKSLEDEIEPNSRIDFLEFLIFEVFHKDKKTIEVSEINNTLYLKRKKD